VVRTALQKGSEDNLTALVIQVREGQDPARVKPTRPLLICMGSHTDQSMTLPFCVAVRLAGGVCVWAGRGVSRRGGTAAAAGQGVG
jgi:hypothetical protein